MYFKLLWNEFAALPEVEAITLGGSRAGEDYDEKSDYDLYIYCIHVPSENIRKQILEKCCQYMETGNSFWELEDDCTLKDGIDIDIVYRNIEDFSQTIHSVVEEHTAYNGYTTCMWHNLLHSRILYDENGRMAALQDRYRIPYPDRLRENIISKNLRLLTGNLPSYDAQIKKAAARKDMVSVNHRTAAFLESYFDILFALNKLTHPGEKRMVSYAIEQAEILPADFEENLNRLFQNLFANPDKAVQIFQEMITELERVVKCGKRSKKEHDMRLLFEMDKKDYDKCTHSFVRDSARSIIIKDKKVAMIHSTKYDYYKFPGGGIEDGETPMDAMIRETREESGLVVLLHTIREYGYVHRIQKSDDDETECFIQDNFYYLCETTDEIVSQELDDYEAEETYTLEYMEPDVAIRKNRHVMQSPYNQMMFEREARVLELLIAEGLFEK